jgi:branched-subunit amino acid transport protein
MLAPFGGVQAVSAVPTMWLSIIVLIPVAILEIMAIPGLFAKKAAGWKYMYWAQLVTVVSSLLQLNIIGALISFVIGFYILFQIKSFYK